MSAMNEPPKRRFWQIHLSSALAAMVCAGILLGLNVVGREWPTELPDESERAHVWGWPCYVWVCIEYHAAVIEKHGEPALESGGSRVWMYGLIMHRKNDTMYYLDGYCIGAYGWQIVVNVLTTLGLISFAIIVFECPIRRREARKS